MNSTSKQDVLYKLNLSIIIYHYLSLSSIITIIKDNNTIFKPAQTKILPSVPFDALVFRLMPHSVLIAPILLDYCSPVITDNHKLMLLNFNEFAAHFSAVTMCVRRPIHLKLTILFTRLMQIFGILHVFLGYKCASLKTNLPFGQDLTDNMLFLCRSPFIAICLIHLELSKS